MNLIKNIVPLMVMCAGFLGNQAVASDAPVFRLTQRVIPERGQVNALQIGVGQQQVSLILPRNWRVGQSAEGLVLQAADFSSTIVVQSVKNSESLSKELKANLAPTAPQVEFADEYAWATGVGQATVIDAKLGEADHLEMQSRTYIIKLKDSSLVVTLRASVKHFEQAQWIASSLLASLRAE